MLFFWDVLIITNESALVSWFLDIDGVCNAARKQNLLDTRP